MTLPDPLHPIPEAEAQAAFAAILDGDIPESDIAAFLIALSDRGETASEIAGAARAMRERMIPVKAPANAIDVCGTGGDGHHTLNVSTAVSLVVAAAGVPVAKHGNRAASSKAGAADTLEALGLNLDRAAATAEESLEELGLAFLFAQTHHPALGKLAPVRKAIGRRTIFNIVGPLCNPGRVTRQLMGVARTDYLGTVASAMQLLGTESAMIVAGDEGLDELSIAGGSRIIRLGACGDREEHVVPGDVGVEPHPLTAIRGGDAAYNAAALSRLLQGEAGPYRDAVLLNASAALIVAGRTADWQEGADIAGEAIDDGSAENLLQRWITF